MRVTLKAVINAFTLQYLLMCHDHAFSLTTDQLSWQLSLKACLL